MLSLDSLPKPTTRTMVAAEISTDPRFQRDLIPARVRKIAADLDLDGLGVIVVSERNGTMPPHHVAIDGQHRLAALEFHGMGEWEVECRVYSGLTLAQEAALYRRLNDTRRITSWDDFKAGVTAGDEECIAISAVAKQAGWRITGQTGEGQVCCIAALRQIYRQPAGGEVLLNVLRDARHAWGSSPAGVEGDLLRGLALVYSTYGDQLDRLALIKKLAKAPGGASHLLGAARGLRDLQGGSVAKCVGTVVVGLYNKGRRVGQLAPL